ncbi:hypothetical protein tb265_16090 [Gemmatimonadetes bacterium T265]|nr:hypothetical protein tb265_16090 [Gemmatimonadetes bacterium T265]
MRKPFPRCAVVAAILTSLAALAAGPGARPAVAQMQEPVVTHMDLVSGRSYPITTPSAIARVTVANPDVADVVVVGERDVVVNGKAPGETDVIVLGPNLPRRHYRVTVRSGTERRQIALAVRFAEVRRDFLANFGVSGLYRDPGGSTRAGTGTFNSDAPFTPTTGGATGTPQGSINLGTDVRFATVLTTFGSRNLLALIQAEQQRGTARILAEPTILAANREDASFLAGGEIPIPIVQGGAATTNGSSAVTIVFKEFGVRLTFNGEVLNDSLIKLRVAPEVSALDYGNAITLQGFRIPAFTTRRVASTVDVHSAQSLIISGLMNDSRQRVRTGLPYLSDIPILGALFSSTQWQRNETELLVVVTPVILDPERPTPGTQPGNTLRIKPDTALPARDAMSPRLPH